MKLQICQKKIIIIIKITIELDNAAQKGRYERETHARYRPDGNKMQNYEIHDKIEKIKWV